MGDPANMLHEWFGGEHQVEVWDANQRAYDLVCTFFNIHRKVTKLRERWWNAYMLIYERVQFEPQPQPELTPQKLQPASSAYEIGTLTVLNVSGFAVLWRTTTFNSVTTTTFSRLRP